jgi:hypothetical protein
VLGFEDDADAFWRQLLLDPVGDLGGQSLLDLEVAGE